MAQLDGQIAVITGGSGGLGSAMAEALAEAGAKVVVVSRSLKTSAPVVERIKERGGQAQGIAADVMDRLSLERAHGEVREALGPVDILVNGAGGNRPKATAGAEGSFFDLDPQAVREVLELNFLGTFESCQVFGHDMAARGRGAIVNVASMAAQRPLTRVVAYSAAKAAVVNFTQWLAVYMAQEYGRGIRVNALAPGFFLTEQNQYLLIDAESGEMTERGKKIIEHTPMARLGEAGDLVSTLLWLVDPKSAFVTGTVIPVDGGFSAYGGV